MIQIIKENRPENTSDKFVKAFANLGKEAQNQLGTHIENTTLKDKYGTDLFGIEDPSTRQEILKQELQYRRAKGQAEGSQKVDYTGRKGANKSNGTTSSSVPTSSNKNANQELLPSNSEINQKRGETPQVVNKNEYNQYNNQNPSGQFPQRQTSGQVEPVSDVNQLWEEAQQIAAQSSENGIPMQVEEAFDIAQRNNQQRIANNELIKNEEAEQILEQQRYGTLGLEALQQYFPEETENQASPELKSLFAKKAEEIASNPKYKTEAEVKKQLTLEAKKIKDSMSNIKNAIKPPQRIWNKVGNAIEGIKATPQDVKNSTRIKLKPLLDDGLYDEARNLLDEKGYYPEEREDLLTDQSEITKKYLAQFPKIEHPRAKNTAESYLGPQLSDKQRSDFRNNLSNILRTDPNTNLILLRKSYEDKGIDWLEFKRGIDELDQGGQFEMTPEQLNQFDLLETPPLDRLGAIFHQFGLRGR